MQRELDKQKQEQMKQEQQQQQQQQQQHHIKLNINISNNTNQLQQTQDKKDKTKQMLQQQQEQDSSPSSLEQQQQQQQQQIVGQQQTIDRGNSNSQSNNSNNNNNNNNNSDNSNAQQQQQQQESQKNSELNMELNDIAKFTISQTDRLKAQIGQMKYEVNYYKLLTFVKCIKGYTKEMGVGYFQGKEKSDNKCSSVFEGQEWGRFRQQYEYERQQRLIKQNNKNDGSKQQQPDITIANKDRHCQPFIIRINLNQQQQRLDQLQQLYIERNQQQYQCDSYYW